MSDRDSWLSSFGDCDSKNDRLYILCMSFSRGRQRPITLSVKGEEGCDERWKDEVNQLIERKWKQSKELHVFFIPCWHFCRWIVLWNLYSTCFEHSFSFASCCLSLTLVLKRLGLQSDCKLRESSEGEWVEANLTNIRRTWDFQVKASKRTREIEEETCQHHRQNDLWADAGIQPLGIQFYHPNIILSPKVYSLVSFTPRVCSCCQYCISSFVSTIIFFVVKSETENIIAKASID